MINVALTKSLASALDYAVDFCREFYADKIDIIVPDKLSLFMEKHIFESLNISASFNISISTLNRFAKRNTPLDKSQLITKTGSIILINKILNENANNFKVIVSGKYSFTYAEEIFKTIYQLKASKILPAEMFSFTSPNKQLENKIRDLAIVYDAYETAKAGLLDSSDQFVLSTFNITEGRRGHKILFVGFDDFTAIEYSMIEQLGMTNEVYITCYKTKSSNTYIFNDEVRTQLKNIAMINQIGYDEVWFENKSSELNNFLQDNLFGSANNSILIKPEQIKIYSASNFYDEVEEVARSIKTQILNGKNFSDFGVAIFDIENKQNIIEEIFSKYEINYYLDGANFIQKSVFYKFLLSIFKFNFEGNNLDHLIDIINSPFLKIELETKKKIILRLINVNFRGKSIKNINFDEEALQQVGELEDFLSSILFKRDADLRTLKNILNNAFQSVKIEEELQNLSSNVDLRYKVLLKNSYEAVMNLFDEVEKFYPVIDAENFYEMLSHLSQVVSVNNLPLTLDAVQVVDANNFSEPFSNLYLVNCTSTSAPSLKNDCGIILDKEIEELNFSHKLAPTIAHINKLARLRLFNSALLFKDSLNISYTKTQSELIKELTNKCFVETNGVKIALLPQFKLPFGEYQALSQNDYIQACMQNHSTENLEQFKDKIKSFNVVKDTELFSLKTVSATLIEDYFKCPLLAFFKDILKLKPREKNEVLSFDIGNILHEIVYNYYKLNKNVGEVHDFVQKSVQNYLENVERLKLNANSPIIAQLIEEGVRVLKGLDYIDQNSDFVPKYFELEFNKENALDLGNSKLRGKVDRVDICYKNKSPQFFRIIDYKTGNANAGLNELYYGKKLQLFLYSLAVEKLLNLHASGSFYLPIHNKYEKKDEFTYSVSGFFENTPEVVHALDKRLNPGDKSDISNLTLSKDLLAKRTSDRVLTEEEFSMLKNYSKKLASKAVEEMQVKNISPSPVEDKICKYCPYAQICLRKANCIKTRSNLSVNKDSFREEV